MIIQIIYTNTVLYHLLKTFAVHVSLSDVHVEGVHRYSPQRTDINMKIMQNRTNYAPPVINDMFTVYPAMLGIALPLKPQLYPSCD